MDIYLTNKKIHHDICIDKKHYKTIILIIASVNEINNYFIKCWEQYMNEYNDVKSYFVYSDPDIEYDIMVYENKLVCKTTENFVPGIFNKTNIAMQFCNTMYSYDYILRTNLSSFFHIPSMIKSLENQPNTNFIASPFSFLPNDEYGIKKDEQNAVNNYLNLELNDKFVFLHGSFILFSKDIAEKYLYNLNKISNTEKFQEIMKLPDDILISLVMYNFLTLPIYEENKLYYPIEFTNNYYNQYRTRDIEETYNYFPVDVKYSIRNRINENDDSNMQNRYKDIINYIKQVQYFYNKPNFMQETIYKLIMQY